LEEVKVDVDELAENVVGPGMQHNEEASGRSSQHLKQKRYTENGPF